MQFAVLRPKGAYAPRDRAPVRSLAGAVMGDAPLSPALLVDVVVRELRASPRQPIADVLGAIARAGAIFATQPLGGQTFDAYVAATNACSGLPMRVAEDAARELRVAMESIRRIVDAQRPRGVGITTELGAGVAATTRWIPRGAVLGVIAPSNHPGTHVAWLQALALGYKVVVKPGGRDPFTPYRLALALLEAGLAPEMLAFLPGDHATAAHVVDRVDCALVYGTGATVQRLAGTSKAHVVRRGPGYSKILVGGGGAGVDALARSIVESASGDAGVKCTNASGVLCDRPDYRDVRDAVAARMAAIPARPIGDPEARLPVFARDEAHRLHAATRAVAERAGLRGVGPAGEGAIVDFGDGTAALTPVTLECTRGPREALDVELPFPALWLAEVADLAKVDDYGETLVMGVLGGDEALRRRVVDDPRVGKVSCGTWPTHRSDPTLPHDGFLASALMTAKAVIGAGNDPMETSR